MNFIKGYPVNDVLAEYFALRRITPHTPAFCWAVACGLIIHPDYPKV